MEKKWLFTFLVVLLYIPFVFMGANVFFPKYSSYESFDGYRECYPKPVEVQSATLTAQQEAEMQKCQKETEEKRIAWEKEKQRYESWKYFFITVVNLFAVLAIIKINLDESIRMGLFTGAVITSFVATFMYFATKSIPGFIVLGLILISCIFIINKKITEIKR